jgi:LCP family protein required for cell wall assembly
MLLVRFNPDRPAIRVLSIPKDSQVVLPKIGLDKISRAYNLGGAPLAARVVSRTLNNVPLDRYISINMDALRQLVDRMGGIEVFVPQRMAYQDRTQRLQIDLEPGWQTLNGEQAEQFARFRASNIGDLDRVQRQQMLIAALRDRLTSPAVLPQLPEITKIMQTAVQTNLSPEEMKAIASFIVQMKPENWQMSLLPGDLSPLSQDPSSYWLYTSGQDQIMTQYFGTSAIGNLPQPKPLTSLKIAVQNASGKPHLSQKVVRYLKQKGFTNVYAIADWSDIQRQTDIIVQKGNVKAATKLQQILALGQIQAAAIGDLESSLTIRIGKDWR